MPIISGVDGTTPRPVLVDSAGRVLIAGVAGATPVPVSATDLDIRNLAKTLDELYAVLRTDAGAAYDARDRNWTLTETVPVSAASLPLPAGAATLAEQQTQTTALQLIDDLRAALGSVATDRLNVQTAGLTDRVALSDPRERAPANILISYADAGVAPHGATTRWTYTVPAARAALLALGEVRVLRVTATGTPGRAEAIINLSPAAGGGGRLMHVGIITGAVGDGQMWIATPHLWLEAGDAISCLTADGSTGGTIDYMLQATVTEFTA